MARQLQTVFCYLSVFIVCYLGLQSLHEKANWGADTTYQCVRMCIVLVITNHMFVSRITVIFFDTFKLLLLSFWFFLIDIFDHYFHQLNISKGWVFPTFFIWLVCLIMTFIWFVSTHCNDETHNFWYLLHVFIKTTNLVFFSYNIRCCK